MEAFKINKLLPVIFLIALMFSCSSLDKEIVQKPPDIPSEPYPADEAVLASAAVEFLWTCSDPDGDRLTYDLYLDIISPPAIYDSLIDTTAYTPELLQYRTAYYWQIVAIDSTGLETAGPVWSFSIGDDVTGPEVKVVSPDGGELLYIGSVFDITWSGSDDDGIASYKLEQSTDGGSSWLDIQDWTSGNPQVYAWTVPEAAALKQLIKVSCRDFSGNITGDESDSVFTVWPAGGIIAFASNRTVNYDIFTMFSDGSNQINLTNSAANEYHPAWSPDCARIAFVTDRDDNQEIYIMNSDGTDAVNLSDNPAGDQLPAWSPDGTRIAFSSNRTGNWDIFVMNIDGSDQHNITNNDAEDYYCSWNPAGDRLVFHSNRGGNWDVYVMDDDGLNLERLTTHTAVEAYPAWSPDGRSIAYRSSIMVNNDIYIMDVDGSNQRNISNDSSDDQWPQWSPDGGKIVFFSNRTGEYEIYVINTDGTNLVNLTNDPANADVNGNWSQIY